MASNIWYREQAEIMEKRNKVLKHYGITFFVVFAILISLPPDNPVLKEIGGFAAMAVLALAGVAYFRAGIKVRIRKTAQQEEADRQELLTYLNQVAPIAAFDASQSDAERTEAREMSFKRRFVAGIGFYEQKLGRPVTDAEHRYVERLLGVKAEDFQPSFIESLFALAKVAAEGAERTSDELTQTIKAELREHLGDKAAHFSRFDIVELATQSATERLTFYKEYQELLKQGTKYDDASVERNQPETPPTPVDEQELGIDKAFISLIEEEDKFNEYVELQRAKIVVLYEHDPEKKDKRLRVLNHLVRQYRESRGW